MEQLQVATRLMQLYCFNHGEYREMYRKGDGSSAWRHVPEQLTMAEMLAHLDGEKTIGVYGRSYRTIFMTLDVDEGDIGIVMLLTDKLAEVGVPREYIYVSASGKKGYHIDIFFEGSVHKSKVENLYDYIMMDENFMNLHIECFPLHHTAVKIPLGVHQATGRRCWYLDPENCYEPIEDFDYVAKIKRLPAGEFEAVVHNINKMVLLDRIEAAKKYKWLPTIKQSDDERPYLCLPNDGEPMIEGPGERHDKMRRKAVWLCCYGGCDEDTIYNELLAWMSRQNKAYVASTDEEIDRDARELARDVFKKYGGQVATKCTKSDPGQKYSDEWINRALIITASDMYKVMLGKTRVTRQVAFLICVFCKCFNNCCMSYDLMAEKIGCSKRAVQEAVKDLLSYKVIKLKEQGGLRIINGEPRLIPNEYVFATEHRGYGALPFLKKYMEFNFLEEKDRIDQFYYVVLTQFFEMSDLKRICTPVEYRGCEHVLGGE